MQQRRLPPLVALKAFDAVARLGSLRAAASELNVHHTVVGRHLHNLERWLGVQLARSGPNGVVLTAVGQRYFESVEPGLNLIGDATDDLRFQEARELRVWCAPGIAMVWLAPRLDDMRSTVNNAHILLRSAETYPDLLRREADVGIYFAVDAVPGGMGEDLARPRMIAVTSPDLLKMLPLLHEPRDLLRAPLLLDDSFERWTRWFRLNGVDPERPLGTRLWYAHVANEAAARGHGVSLTNELLVCHDLLAGRLVEVVPTETYFGTYRFFAAEDRWREVHIARLRNWLREKMQATLAEYRRKSAPALAADGVT